jgi:regulation of enolase protein 1 (concanavalin A-like superfamily)
VTVIEDTAKTFTPTSDLQDGSYTLTVTERDAIGNWSTPVTRDIVVHTSGPIAPRVKGSATLTKDTPTWSWTGTGRAGAKFRVRLYKAGGTSSIDSIETTALTYAPAAALFANSDTVVFTVRVKEQDAIGNWGGDGNADVRVDNVAPGKPTLTVQPVSPVISTDTRTALTWTWSRSGAATDSFLVSLNGAQVARSSAMTYNLTTFPDSNYTLEVIEFDQAGNQSAATVSARVVVDKTPSAAPTFDNSKTTVSPTNVTKPTWTWVSGLGGSGVFRWSVNTTPVTSGEGTAKTFTPAVDLSDGSYTLTVSENDGVGNWTNPTLASRTLVIQTSGPLAPNVNGSAVLTRTTPTWSWTGTGRVGAKFRVRLYKAGGAASIDSIETTTLAYAPAASFFANSNDVAYTVKVKEQDALGNWGGDGNAVVNVDNVAPSQPTFTVQPASPVLVGDPRNSLAWTWSRTGAVSDSFVVTINGAQVARQTSTTYTLSPIPDNTYAITVTEIDLAANASLVANGSSVVVDKSAPGTPTGVTTSSPTNSSTPTFTWTSGGGGMGTYRVRIDNSDLTTGTTTVTTNSYRPTLTEGSHNLYVQERDAVGNWSANPPAQGTVFVDLNSPSVSKPNNQTITTTSTTVTFTANDGTGTGVQSAACKWGASSTVAATQLGSNWVCAISGLSSKTNSITLEATDGVGRVGSNTMSITLNLPVSTVTFDSKYLNFPTSSRNGSIPYLISGDSRSHSYDYTGLSDGDNAITIQGPPNEVGDRDTKVAHIIVLPKVFFVTVNGTGTGTSWDDAASGTLHRYAQNASFEGMELWVASGDYTTKSELITPDYNISFYGGFNSGNYPSNKNSRSLTNTIISGVYCVNFSSGSNYLNIDGFVMNSLEIASSGTLNATDIRIVNTNNSGGVTARGYGTLNATRMSILSQNLFWSIVSVSENGVANFSGGSISSNRFGGIYGMDVQMDGRLNITGGMNITGNVVPGSSQYEIHGSEKGSIVIDGTVNIDCSKVIKQSSASGTCKGNPIPNEPE